MAKEVITTTEKKRVDMREYFRKAGFNWAKWTPSRSLINSLKYKKDKQIIRTMI